MLGRISLVINDKQVISVPVGDEINIGRDTENSFQITDPKVSRFHCRITKAGSHFVIKDLDSSNGTFVNGAPVKESRLLNGDWIRLGATALLFEVETDEDTREGPAEGREAILDGATAIDGSLKMKDLTDFYHTGISLRDFRKILEKLSTLFEIGNIINVHRESSSLLNAILDQIVRVIKADRYYLLLREEKTGELEPAATFPVYEGPGPLPGVSKTIMDTVFTEGKSILSSDAFHDNRFQGAKSIVMYDIQTIMCVPLRSHEKILGVIHVDSRDPKTIFTKDDLKLLTAIGISSGIAIENLHLYEDLKRLFRSTVKSLVAALEANDPYTGGHSVRVADYSRQLAECLGLPSQEVEKIELAAFLHDIGKIGIPQDVLNKPDSFDTCEFEMMRDHPAIGYKILSEIEGMEEIARMVRHHHERFDGRGYPDGLAGANIPLGSRIMGAADAFDAMTTDRPYRKRLSVEEAYKEIARLEGTQFDPEIVDVLKRCMIRLSLKMG